MLDPKVLLGGVWAVALAIAGAVLVSVRGRIRVLQFTVDHDNLAVSIDDPAFGQVQVTYAGVPVTRLWMTRVTLRNDTGKDFEKLEVRVFTNDDTMLLGERIERSASTYKIGYTEAFEGKLALAAGVPPTAQQQHAFNHGRDFLVPVLNRNDWVTWNFLTSVPPAPAGKPQATGPSVWIDIQQAGLRVRYRPNVPLIHGVPTKKAAILAIIATIVAYLASAYFLRNPWLAAAPSGIVALFGQTIGAYMYKAYRLVIPVVTH